MDDITNRRNMWTQVKTVGGIFGGVSCIILLLNGKYTRISEDQTEVAYQSG
jgi:hypothetical protein